MRREPEIKKNFWRMRTERKLEKMNFGISKCSSRNWEKGEALLWQVDW